LRSKKNKKKTLTTIFGVDQSKYLIRYKLNGIRK